MLKKIQNLKWYYKTIIWFILCLILCFISVKQTHALRYSEVAHIGDDIFDQFEAYFPGFDSSRYSHVICKPTTNSSTDTINCYAIYNGDYDDSLVFKTTTGYWTDNFSANTSWPYLQMNISTTGGYASHYMLTAHCNTEYCYYTSSGTYPKNEWSNLSISTAVSTGKTEPYFFYGNFDPVDIYNNNLSSNITFTSGGISPFNINTFTTSYFEQTGINIFSNNVLTYDPDLLVNDNRFKKVCVNNQRSLFSIIPDNVDFTDDGVNHNYHDYMLAPVFVKGIQYGDFYYNFGNNNSNLLYMSYDNGNINTFLNQYDLDSYYAINFFRDTTEIVDFRNEYGNLYDNLYGWSIFPLYFLVKNNTLSNEREWTTFVYMLESAYSETVDCINVIQDDGNSVCVESGSVDQNNVIPMFEDTCFYIPVNYSLKIWDTNEYGDITGTVTINGVTFNSSSDYFEDKYTDVINDNSYSGYLGYFQVLVRELTFPLTFISGKISRCFNGLPYLIRYFLISVVVLGFIIGLVMFLTGGK